MAENNEKKHININLPNANVGNVNASVPPQPPVGAAKPVAPKAHASVQASKVSAKKQFSNSKKPSRNKAMATGILAFLLAGGAVFIMMIMMGTKDIKDQDARMNFSYGNVLAGAVAPLFEALGITDNDNANEDSTRRRIQSRSPEMFALSIEDWLGIKPDTSSGADSDSSSGGNDFFSDYSDSRYSSEASAPIPRAEFGMSGGMGGSGGGSTGISSKGHQGANTFSSKAAQDVFKGDSKLTADGQLPSMKGKKAINTLKASRQMLGTALTSGSATVARNNWSAAFGQSKALSGKSSGFANGKLNKEVFRDANAAALDKIESGEIKNLKLSDIDGKSGSVPTASVPQPVDKSASDLAKDGDSMEKMIVDTLGDSATSALSGMFDGKDKDSASSETSKETGGEKDNPVSGKDMSKSNFRPSHKYTDLIENNEDSVYCPDGCNNDGLYYKDNPITYEKTKHGFVLAVLEGSQKEVDDEGNTIPGTEKTYKDKYLINPKGNPKVVHMVSSVTDSSGKTTTSYKEQL